tara:strand:+ start:119983 stop:120087 length:105 start_codon:yes stop_codon:yes gene_type:complete
LLAPMESISCFTSRKPTVKGTVTWLDWFAGTRKP